MKTSASTTHHGVDPLSLGARRIPIRHQRPHRLGRLDAHDAGRAAAGAARSIAAFGAKLRQIVRALELERALSKDEILALYLTLAPYGGNLEGIRAARSPISARSRAS